ncbi:hypothetical protein CROQUDRAFT_670188 [Cronartium quercuum f. sp. fusiforme G11]|uniref:Isocitrate lyase n=1 Tax=Cronartium quercuum f. sp. fusiforme G11 TaxID=708437 RepID=A0A9P6NJB0_9BASI|nr:hypothetical protein CROQUDRAFT_670188 [Cronartium quercuum f. sp. fusiforme G11]
MASGSTHQTQLNELTESISKWFASPRFQTTKRSYPASLIASKRGTLPVESNSYPNLMARTLFDQLTTANATGRPLLTMGALDPVQQSQMAAHLPLVYVSGWATSSTFVSGSDEVGPDLADYPYTAVPAQVRRLAKAQMLHDRKQWDAQCQLGPKTLPGRDQLRPIVADGDTGHGGLSSVMKLAKAFGEAGAAGVHFEDQLHGGKKCGHQAGKVLVPTGDHLGRLRAARMQWDIMGLDSLLIARTDAESSRLISSDHDPRDHRFILGVEGSQPGRLSLVEEIIEAEERLAPGQEIDEIERRWLDRAELMTFDQAVERIFERHSLGSSAYPSYFHHVNTHNLSHSAAAAHAASYLPSGTTIDWNPHLARTREGYYRFQGGLEPAIQRALHFAPYADLIWVETKKPDLQQARAIASRVRERFPNKWLVYNLSPSFNWSQHGFSDVDLREFVWELGQCGFVLQLISLAGLHSTATMTAELAQRFKTDGMLAYVELVQRREKGINCEVLTHQRWSGAEYVDRILNAVSAGSAATAAMGADSTEKSF